VRPEGGRPLRGGLAVAALVHDITRAVLDAGRIPYTSYGLHNLASQRIACSAGYYPAWTSIVSGERG
jgi:hypothetical protein